MSDGPTQLEQRIEHFEDLLRQMRQETREAHSVLKQLRLERRDIERRLTKDVKQMVDDQVGELVKTELDKIGPAIREQTNMIYAKVGKEADKLIDIALGKEFSRRNNREDLRPQLAAKMKIWIREVMESEGHAL